MFFKKLQNLSCIGYTVEANELAGLDGKRICHDIFRPLLNFGLLQPQFQIEAKWLSKNHLVLNEISNLHLYTNFLIL